MPKLYRGGKKPKKKPKETKKRRKKGTKKGTPKRKGKKQLSYIISQPRKKRYSVHKPSFHKRSIHKRSIHNPRYNRNSFRSHMYTDSSSYKNIMGAQDYKRNVDVNENIDGLKRGMSLKQDNDNIFIQRY